MTVLIWAISGRTSLTRSLHASRQEEIKPCFDKGSSSSFIVSVIVHTSLVLFSQIPDNQNTSNDNLINLIIFQ